MVKTYIYISNANRFSFIRTALFHLKEQKTSTKIGGFPFIEIDIFCVQAKIDSFLQESKKHNCHNDFCLFAAVLYFLDSEVFESDLFIPSLIPHKNPLM